MDTKQLPHLLQLLDDDSPTVQTELRRHLGSLGERLNIELARLSVPPSPAQRRLLQEVLRPQAREALREAWTRWLSLPESLGSLEKACALMSEFQSGYIYPTDLSVVLDQLAQDYREEHSRPDASSLAAFLFKERGLRGSRNGYYRPLNSDLVAVVKEGRGIPLSLCLIYLFTGARLGLDISGCDFPGHFLARVREADREYLVDCFNGGTEVDHKVAASGAEASPWGVQEALNREARPRGIVARLLRNLAKAFEESRQPEDLGLMAELSVRLEQDDLGRSAAQVQGSDAVDGPRFQTGTVVRTRKGFRAVVVDFDLSCKTPESWRRRQESERLNQTWYHLFLDQSDEVAYAPEDNLELENPAGRIEHPLMSAFFGRYENGKYWRNLKVWPGT